MEDSALVTARFERGHAYLRHLRAPNQPPWLESYGAYLRGELELVEAMTLIHPDWLRRTVDRGLIFGDRTFGPTTAGHCESARLWRYACDLRHTSLHADHLFPHSHGGPTWAANRLTLCDVHNRIKGADVHLYPWEAGEPSWLPKLLERYAEFV